MNLRTRLFSLLLPLLFFSIYLNGQIDLELNLEQAIENPDQWSNYSVVATITNTSSNNASGVVVNFAKAEGIVYVGADPFTLSQGAFSSFGEEIWNVGELAGGASATLQVNYFNKLETAPVSYAQVIAANETDTDSTPGNGTRPTVNEDDEANTNGGTPPVTGDEIDLELTMVQSVLNPEQWEDYFVNVKIKNTGSETATGVKMTFAKPDGVVYVGGNEFAISQGSFAIYGDQTWTVGSLAPGAEASINVDYFLLIDEAPIAYAEVIAANETDVDSTPGNGTPPMPNEDDEASTGQSGPPPPSDLGCYFEKTYQDIPQAANGIAVTYIDELSNGNFLITGVTTGLPPALVYSVYQTEVTSDGTLVNNDIIGQIPDFRTSITREGYLDVNRAAMAISNLEVTYQAFNGNTFWQKNFNIIEAASIDIDGAAPLNENGYMVSGIITKTGESANNFYPFYIKLDNNGNEVTRLIGEKLPAYGTILFEYESETGYYFSQSMPTVSTLRTFKTNKSLIPLYTKVAIEPYGVTLGNIQEDSNGFTFINLKIGVEPGTSAMSNFSRVVTINPQGAGIFAYDVSLAYNSIFNHRILAQDDGIIASFNSAGKLVIVRLNAANERLYQKEYDNSVASIQLQASDGSLLFTGFESEFLNPPNGPQQNSLFLLKTTSLANKTPACTAEEKPDLILADIQVPNYAHPGDQFQYTADVSNIGDIVTNDAFEIKAYFSNDNNLSADDLLVGSNTKGLLFPNQTLDDVYADIILPTTITADGYIIIKADGDELIPESDETNNTIFTPIKIIESLFEGDCELPIAEGSFICANSESNGSSDITIGDGTSQYIAQIAADGSLTDITSGPDVPETTFYSITNDQVKKISAAGGAIIYEKTIPANLFNSYSYFSSAAQFNDGYILFAYKNFDASTISYDALWAIKTDGNLNPILEKEIGPGGGAAFINAYRGLQINNSQLAFARLHNTPPSHSISLEVIDEQLNLISTSVYVSGNNVDLTIRALSCGNFSIHTSHSLGFCPHGSCSAYTINQGNFINGIFVIDRFINVSELSSLGNGTRISNWFLKTADGGSVSGTQNQPLPFIVGEDAPIEITKSINGIVVEEYSISGSIVAKQLMEIGGALYFLIDNSGVLELVRLDCLERKADLILSNLEVASTVTANSSIDYTFDVSNIGLASSLYEYKIKVYYSTDNELSADDVLADEISMGNIDPNEVIIGVQGSSVVPDLPAGDYFFLMVIDADGQIEEFNELNNIIVRSISIEDLGQPDDYCEAESEFPWHEWFSEININYEVFWPSGKSVYSDFTTTAPIATLERGSEEGYVFSITYSYFTFDAYIRYYVDFNQNGIFEESEGGSVVKSAIPPGNGVIAVRGATHNIPAAAKLGTTRARFIISRDPITSACDNVAFGEIEDYTMEIVDELPNNRLAGANDDLPFTLYPNPVIEELSVDIREISGVENISIYNALGHLMLSKDLDKTQATEKVQFDVTDLMDGTYAVHVSGAGFKPRAKLLVVQRLR